MRGSFLGTLASSHRPKKPMHVRLIGVSKIVSRSEREWLFVSVWRPVQGVPRLSPDDRGDRLQPPLRPNRHIKTV